MNFANYAGARQGIRSGLNNIMGAGQYGQGSYNDTLRTLAAADLGRTGADKNRAETSILDDQIAGRGDIPAALQGLKLPEGVTADVISAVLRANKDPSLKDLFGGLGESQNTGTQRQAVDYALGQNGVPQNTETANLLNTIAKPGEAYMPFAGGEYGTTNQSTGAYAPSASNLALATDRTASAGAHNAASRNYDASAREHNAGARAKGVLELAPGASAFSIADLLHGMPTPGGAVPQPVNGGTQPTPPMQPSVNAMDMQDVPGLADHGRVGGSVLDTLSQMVMPDDQRALANDNAPPASPPAAGGVLDALQGVPAPAGAAPLATAPGASAKATQLMQNLEAAGLKPGTPEYQKAVLQAVTKASANKPPAGYRVDPNDPTRQIPIPGGPGDPKNKPLSESQSKAVMFATRADAMDKQLSSSKYDPTTTEAAWDRSLAGGTLTNWMASKQGQVYINQGRNFVAAVLRRESGATITKSEWTQGQQLYIPMPGDDKEVIAQKKYNRTLAIEGIKAEAGDAIGRVKVPMPPGEAPPATNARGWPLHRDASGNMAYVGPNGEIEEVQ